MASVGAILRGKPSFDGIFAGVVRGFKVPSPAFRRCPKIRYLTAVESVQRAKNVRSPANRCSAEARCSTAARAREAGARAACRACGLEGEENRRPLASEAKSQQRKGAKS